MKKISPQAFADMFGLYVAKDKDTGMVWAYKTMPKWSALHYLSSSNQEVTLFVDDIVDADTVYAPAVKKSVKIRAIAFNILFDVILVAVPNEHRTCILANGKRFDVSTLVKYEANTTSTCCITKRGFNNER